VANQGQLWSAGVQIGKETTPGTAVAATRKVYVREPTFNRMRAPRVQRFATGTRDNVRDVTNGPIEADGSFSVPMSAEELLELFAITLQATPTPTTPSGATLAKLWTFKPGGSIDSATFEFDDGARVWSARGYRGNTMTIEGSAEEENTVSFELFGTDVVQSGVWTGALSERVPSFMEGWQTVVYLDAFGTAAPFSTPIPAFLRNWSIQFNGNLDRVYTAQNTLAANRVTTGEIDVTATLTVDAYSAQTVTEFANWDAGTKRRLGLEFLGPANGIEAGVNEVQTIALTGTPTGGTFTVVVLGQTTAAIAFNANAAAVQTAINNALAALGSTWTVTVTAGPLPAAVTVTFDGAGVSGRNQPQMSLGTNSLTGGTSPTAAFATTTPGRSGRRYVQVDLPGAWTSFNLGGSEDGIRTYELSMQGTYDSVLGAMMAVIAQTDRATIF
jgi:hypothetical protein